MVKWGGSRGSRSQQSFDFFDHLPRGVRNLSFLGKTLFWGGLDPTGNYLGLKWIKVIKFRWISWRLCSSTETFWWFLIGLIHVSWLTRLIIYESPPAKNKTHWVKDKLWVVDQISFMKRILSLCGWCLTNPTLLLISFPHWTMCSLSPPKTLRLAFVWFSIQKTGRWGLTHDNPHQVGIFRLKRKMIQLNSWNSSLWGQEKNITSSGWESWAPFLPLLLPSSQTFSSDGIPVAFAASGCPNPEAVVIIFCWRAILAADFSWMHRWMRTYASSWSLVSSPNFRNMLFKLDHFLHFLG